MCNLKVLWINVESFPLTHKVKRAIRKNLGISKTIPIHECKLDNITSRMFDDYSHFISTSNCHETVQDLYDILNKYGQLYVIDTKQAGKDCDWIIEKPSGTCRLKFKRLLKPVVINGELSGLK